MYLKSIEIQGFKSFANKTVLEFNEGITGVVGPNGSGKSNIADAVRWVLGEQSPSKLRGGGMQDVIFSGTATKSPLSYAKVSIILDNEDHSLPIDYREVNITRKLYRSGESEYFINNSGVRLRDIQELFYDTGIGKEGYSIIGQGQIEKILSGRAEERRDLIDEACGIVKFKKKKKQAEKKLEDTEFNLIRIRDIVGELEQRVGPLKVESDKAKEYILLRDKLKELEISDFISELTSLNKKKEELNNNSNNVDKELVDVKNSLFILQRDFKEGEEEIKLTEENIEGEREKLSELSILLNNLYNNKNRLEEGNESSLRREAELKERLEAVLKKEEKEKEEEKKVLEEINNLNNNKNDNNLSNDIKDELDLLRNKRDEISNTIREKRNNIEKNGEKLLSINSEISRYKTLLEQFRVSRSEQTSKSIRLQGEKKKLQTDIEKLKEEKESITNIISEKDNTRQTLLKNLSSFKNDIAKYIKEEEELKENYHKKNSELKALLNIAERYEGYGLSVKKVMEEKKSLSLGTVSDLITCEKKYEKAVEVALGGAISNIVTKDSNDAKHIVDFLKKNKLGRVTILPLNDLKSFGEFKEKNALGEKGSIGIASNLINISEKYKKIGEHLLGKILVVENIENAIEISKKYRASFRIVTLEGEILSTGGAITGGAYKNSSNLLGRKRELEELKEEVENIKKKISSIREKVSSIEGEEKRQMNLSNTLGEEIESLRYEDKEKEVNLNSLFDKKVDVDGRIKELKEGELKFLDDEKNIKESLSALELKITDYNKEEESEKKNIDKLNASYKEIEEEILKKEKNYTAIKVSDAVNEEKINSIYERKNRQEEILKEIFKEKESINKKIEEEIKSREDSEINIKNNNLEIEKTLSLKNEKDEEFNKLVNKNKDLQEKYREFISNKEELMGIETNLSKEKFRLDNSINSIAENIEKRCDYIWEEYETTYNNAKNNETYMKLSLEKDNKKEGIKELKVKIRNLGDVNVSAIEEYDNVGEKFETLSTQKEDLEVGKEKLLEIIKDLDEDMRTRFKEGFSEINDKFKGVFKELFGGGEGSITIDENEDPLTCDIKIIASPPGKRLQNMMQLSGGEKALSAIALLFAIQKGKPSPFCLLDEIEAALDDANVLRFAHYLNHMIDKTQYIIITHRKGTMSSCDRLYGVTMQEKGISTMVSVNLINEKDLK